MSALIPLNPAVSALLADPILSDALCAREGHIAIKDRMKAVIALVSFYPGTLQHRIVEIAIMIY